MISNEDFQFISKFDNATADMRQAMLQEQQNKHQVNTVWKDNSWINSITVASLFREIG